MNDLAFLNIIRGRIEKEFLRRTMENYHHPPGKTTIAPEVLITIARLTALSTPGVKRLSTTPGDVNQFFKRGFKVNEGVRISVEDDTVYADIFVIMQLRCECPRSQP